MEQTWSLRPQSAPPPALVEIMGGHTLAAQLLAQRGFADLAAARAFLDPACYAPSPPSALVGLDRAAALLHRALEQRQHILVWGDFDVDGQTSTALLVTALRRLAGPDFVQFHVPNRFSDGHGIPVARLAAVLDGQNPAPSVLLTCDTGIAEGPAIAYAKERGMTVVVTDHHDLPPGFPSGEQSSDRAADEQSQARSTARFEDRSTDSGDLDLVEGVLRADAIVNPKLQPPSDRLRTLPGVGVAYKLVQRLYELAGLAGEEQELLDLVALGIVADVSEQVHDARYLLQRGLEQLRRTRRAGLLALMEVSRISPATLDADSIGFQLGPRMNALGRLEDATLSVELLTTSDALRAAQLAARLERLNQQRRLLTSQTSATALEMLERNPALLDFNAVVLAHPNWHRGVVGIVAARIAEQFGKPAVLLVNPPGEPARGSARSVPGTDIGAAIAACRHLLLTYGGHAGAAGLSLLPDNLERLRRELHEQVALYTSDDAAPGLPVDAEVPLGSWTHELIEQVQRLAPFGAGNPAPVFVSRGLAVVDDRRIGREGTHRRLAVRDAADPAGAQLPVIWFHGADAELPAGAIDLAYTVQRREFQGETTIQLSFVDARPAHAQMPAATAQPRVLHDWRDRTAGLDSLPPPAAAVWYVEGTKSAAEAPPVAYAPRWEAAQRRGLPLVLWSIPPAPDLLHWLIAAADPPEIYVCARPSSDDTLASVLRDVAAMCKHALNQREGAAEINRMAARLGTTEAVVRRSLLWLEERSVVLILEWGAGDAVRLAPPEAAPQAPVAPSGEAHEAILAELLAEIRAYRRFFQRAKLSDLDLDGAA